MNFDLNFLLWCIITILHELLGILNIIGLIRMIKLSKNNHFKIYLGKREFFILKLQGILTIISAAIERPMLNISYQSFIGIKLQNILFNIGVIIFPIISLAISWCIALRFYLLYFNLKCIEGESKSTWLSFFDPMFYEKNWYIRNRVLCYVFIGGLIYIFGI